MNTPVVNYAAGHINPNWIFITWDSITTWDQNGGDAAIYYGLEWD
jgi:hypothetical protein